MTTSTGVRVARADGLPENHTYVDTGCEASPTCLACPLPVCRYDVGQSGNGLLTLRNLARNAEMLAVYRTGVPCDALAVRFNVSRRTAYRVVTGA